MTVHARKGHGRPCDDTAVSDNERVRWAKQFAEEGSIAFPSSRTKMSLGLLGCLAFSAVGIWMILQGGVVPTVIGSLSIAFFGVVGVPIILWRWITRKPVVRIDREGVSSGERRARWADIEGFWVWSLSGSAVVVVQLRPEAANNLRAHTHPARRWLEDMNQRLVGPSTISLPSGNGFDPEAMAAWLNSLRQFMGPDQADVLPEPKGNLSAEAAAQFVPDWPKAALRPASPPNPDMGFEAEDAPRSAVGVLQWTSGLLVDGGSGPGGWDYIDLDGWATGDMSGVIDGLGDRNTKRGDLERAVGDELGHPVSLTPHTWVFSRADSNSWWTAPLLVVHRSE